MRPQVHAAGIGRQRALAHEPRSEPGKSSFGFVRKAVVQNFPNEEVEERIPQKLKAFVRLEGVGRMDPQERAMRERASIEEKAIHRAVHKLLDRGSGHLGVGGEGRLAHS
jgi:hypothetical protein